MPANLENSTVATELEKVHFCSNPKERQYQRMFKLSYNCTYFTYASKVMLKILHAWLKQYVNWELPDFQAGFRKSRGIRDQIVNIQDHRESKGIPKKIPSTYASLALLKPLTMWITTNWKILKEKGIPDHLTYLLRNLYKGQEATVTTRHWTADWFKIGKGVCQGCILSPCLLIL